MSSAPHLRDPKSVGELVDWGPVAEPLEGKSMTSGRLLHRNADGSSECGVWVCTPGTGQAVCRGRRAADPPFLAEKCKAESEY